MTRDEQLQEYSDDPEYHLPEHHNPLPELDHVGPAKQAIPQDAFRQAQASGQFVELKKAFRGFAFPMTPAFLIWNIAYVLLSVYARGFMATPVIGNVNLGTIMGLLQFATTFLITWLYIRHMNKNVDPIARRIREELEGASR